MAIVRMSQDQPTRQSSLSPEQQRAQEMQQQQDQRTQQAASRYMQTNARVIPELVGTWDLVPENNFLPYKKTLAIEANASFTLVTQSDNRTSRGKVNVLPNRSAYGSPTTGQMQLFPDTGQIDVLYYDLVDSRQMKITAQDGVKYVARKR